MTTKTENIPDQQAVDDSKDHLKTAAQRAYSDHKEMSVEDEQIVRFLPLVHKIVQKVTVYLKPPLTYEDLVSAGTTGLVKAARDYDPSHQAEFKTYAYIRIRGAILDELRGWSFLPVNVDKQIRKALQASSEIAEETGTAPSDTELAGKLEISIEELHKTFKNARAKHFVSLDSSENEIPPLGASLAASGTETPDKQFEKAELIDELSEAIQQLQERPRQIILLYYQQELTMKQIAEVFDITEPRVSQLHASALFSLSVKLRQWENGR